MYNGVKRAVLEAIFVEQSKEWLPRRTSPRRDVTKSRRRVNIPEVNNLATSRRHHIATSAQKSSPHHLMTNGSEIRASGSVRPEAMNSRAEQHSLRESAWDLYRFSFFGYFFAYYDDVFETRHFVISFHDVLDLFLGLHQTLSQTMD